MLSDLREGTKPKMEIEDFLDSIEDQLDSTARYKEFDVVESDRTVYWATQEMDDADQLKATAKQISTLLLKAGYGLWSVKMIVRDDRHMPRSKWVGYSAI